MLQYPMNALIMIEQYPEKLMFHRGSQPCVRALCDCRLVNGPGTNAQQELSNAQRRPINLVQLH